MDARLEEVEKASSAMLKLAVPTANQATKAFLEQRSCLVSNTFLNFWTVEDLLPSQRIKRSTSVSCGGGSAIDGLMQAGSDPVEDQTDSPVQCVLLSGPSTGEMSAACSHFGCPSSMTASTSTPPTSDGEGEALAVSAATRVGPLAENVEENVIFTTVHVMNLPRRFTCQDLREELDTAGYGGTYDFAHVPVAFATGGISVGYALINFYSPDAAARLLAEWHDSRRFCTRRWGHSKALVVTVALVQGSHRFQTGSMLRKNQRIKNPFFRPWFAPSF